MPDKNRCPACGHEDIEKSYEIKTEDITALYNKNGIRTEYLFRGIPSISLLHCTHCDLKFFSPAVAGDEDFYNQLQQKEWYFLHSDKTEFAYSAKFIRENDKILDVGSGRGVWAGYTGKIKGTFYQGIEYSSKSIELAENDHVNVIKESVEEHAKKYAGYYDIVAAFQVLEHVESIQPFLSACIACLKPGGKLIIAVPNNEGFLKEMINNWLNMPPHHINHWNERSLAELAHTFKIKIAGIHKESVTPVHKLLFYNILMYSRMSRLLRYKSILVDSSFRYKVINKLSFWQAKIMTPFSKKHLSGNGHTIIVTFQK